MANIAAASAPGMSCCLATVKIHSIHQFFIEQQTDMSENYKQLAKAVDKDAGALHEAIPDMMGPYGQLAQAASASGELSSKTRELMAMAIGVVIRCEGCVAYHMRGAIRQGATEAEIAEALGVSIEMGGGPAVVYAGQALAGYKDLIDSDDT